MGLNVTFSELKPVNSCAVLALDGKSNRKGVVLLHLLSGIPLNKFLEFEKSELGGSFLLQGLPRGSHQVRGTTRMSEFEVWLAGSMC